VPYRRNPFFTGQAEILETIHEKLVSGAPADITSSYVIYGLGGVGKSQIAIEYSYRHRDEFDVIQWLRADDYETLLTSYSLLYADASFRGLTGLNLGDETNLETIAKRVRLWFEECQDIKWLLVIDNADKLERDSPDASSQQRQIETIGSLIPRGRSGHVLVTSRVGSAIGQLASQGEELLVMDEDDAKKFLQECSKTGSDEVEDAVALVSELGRLPLAIEQAGGFIREARVSIAEYRRLYKAHRSDALREGLSDTHRSEYYHETVSTTWNVSFNAIEQKDRLAATILRIAAFLDGKRIPKDLFYDADLTVDGNEETISEWKANNAFRTLMAYSLIRSIKGNDALEIHSLVQAVIRDDEKTDTRRCFIKSTELVKRRFPWGSDLTTCRKYLSQAQNSLSIAQDLQIENAVIRYILESVSEYLSLAGQYQDSLVCLERSLRLCEREFGVNHINSANTIHNFGIIYRSQGKFTEALLWYERALTIFDREFGVNHINSAGTINNLGNIYQSQEKFTEAILWYERALTIYDREFGVNHINSANTIQNIGVIYDLQGKFTEALLWYEGALTIFNREFGVNHINSAGTIQNIGVIYDLQGKFTEAVSYCERALKIYDREFGVYHVNSASVLHNLGLVYKGLDDWMLAKSYFERATNLHRQCRGPEHRFSKDSAYELACVIEELERRGAK
jgi:tetratricopeptide (TPR) repeat protein